MPKEKFLKEQFIKVTADGLISYDEPIRVYDENVYWYETIFSEDNKATHIFILKSDLDSFPKDTEEWLIDEYGREFFYKDFERQDNNILWVFSGESQPFSFWGIDFWNHYGDYEGADVTSMLLFKVAAKIRGLENDTENKETNIASKEMVEGI